MNLVQKFKKGKIAVNCDTRKKAERFIEWCYANDMAWFAGDQFTTYYEKYDYITTYKNGEYTDYLKYDTDKYYMEHGYEVFAYDDFMKGVDGMKEFTLDDLKAGKHVVETRDAKKYLVCIANKQLVGVGNGGWIALGRYEQNMQCYGDRNDFDITRVYEIKHAYYFSKMIASYDDNLILVWEREEVKELTMADIEKLVGCKVKIVKEEN